jgi:hypothetical protein
MTRFSVHFRRLVLALGTSLLVIAGAAAPVFACGGLIGPNGNVNLLRTTTLAAYHDGIEHYVTSFEFAGGGGEFGSIVPLPDVPSDVVRGGDWTLQRLVRETEPELFRFDAVAEQLSAAPGGAQVLMTRRIDALDITVLRGGAAEVGRWATEHGFRLPPDAPEVLEFYASRSPIFMAAVFDADAARDRGQAIGDGTPVHITIPTDNPWVPLRILALGRQPTERVQADVYLLTDRAPQMLPQPGLNTPGLALDHSAAASDSLLDDLRSDKGMEWIPGSAWLSKVSIDAAARDIVFDLAIDASGLGRPSLTDAGLSPVVAVAPGLRPELWLLPVLVGLAATGGLAWLVVQRDASRRPLAG